MAKKKFCRTCESIHRVRKADVRRCSICGNELTLGQAFCCQYCADAYQICTWCGKATDTETAPK